MNTQFKKGILELCVLVLASRNDFYGYELVSRVSKYIAITEGTVYPLLRRLTKEGYFTTYLEQSQEGPTRKYYQLSEKGKEYKEQLVCDWRDFYLGVNRLLEEENEDEQK